MSFPQPDNSPLPLPSHSFTQNIYVLVIIRKVSIFFSIFFNVHQVPILPLPSLSLSPPPSFLSLSIVLFSVPYKQNSSVFCFTCMLPLKDTYPLFTLVTVLYLHSLSSLPLFTKTPPSYIPLL